MSPPTLLTLPAELRQKIYHHTLNPPVYIPLSPRPGDVVPDTAFLLTCRKIYHEARALPLHLHSTGRPYDPTKPYLASFLKPFQAAALRRLSIYYLYPADLKQFVGLGAENGYLFGEQTMNLDMLTIHGDYWLTKEMARRWRQTVTEEDVCFDLPRSCRWVVALCGLRGWRQLDVVFAEKDLVNEYWQRESFMGGLFGGFRDVVGEGEGPGFTIWHKDDKDEWGERITVLRTEGLFLHGFPQWGKGDVGVLKAGRECVGSPRAVRAELEGKEEDEDEGEGEGEGEGGVGFHVGERLGEPGCGRLGVCANCKPG